MEESRESCNIPVSIQSLFPSSRGETFQSEGDSYITQGALTGVELTSRHTESRDSRKEVATDKIKALKACLQDLISARFPLLQFTLPHSSPSNYQPINERISPLVTSQPSTPNHLPKVLHLNTLHGGYILDLN